MISIKDCSSVKIGILGGGQLGRMFIQEALNLNADIHILDPDSNAPCKNIASSFTIGSLTDYDTVYNWGKTKDIITIEIEHVNSDALFALEQEGKTIVPPISLLKIVQDKGLQKEFYKKNGIPTADFILVENKKEAEQYRDQFPFVQKLRKGGYDGRGVYKLNQIDDLKNAFDEPSVLEKKVDFDKELSVIISRNKNGETACFPVVECEFNPKVNLVEFLFSPARISKEIETNALNIAEDVAVKSNLIGILAVELFLLKDGTLLVNEIAPRPHNSGHHTIEANLCSQYEQHFRTLFNLAPGSTKAVSAGVMINLLGEEGHTGEARYEGLEEVLNIEGVFVHLYGKKNTKPFRKMGHITIVSDQIETAITKAKEVKEKIRVISNQQV